MVAMTLLLASLGALPGEPMLAAVDAVHVKAYYEAGRFGGWPANYGTVK